MDKKEKLFRIAVWFMVMALFIPFLMAIRYAVFCGDDFNNYVALMEREESSYLLKCVEYAKFCWDGWQGTYSSAFFMGILYPMQFNDHYMALRLVLSLLLISSGLCIITFAHLLARFCNLEKKMAIYLLALFLFPLLSYREYPEVYLWYTGAVVYFLPLIFLFIGFSLLLMAKFYKKSWLYVLSAVFMLLMDGGVLMEVGMGAFLLLILIVIDYIREKKFNRPFLGVFAVTFLGACLNAFAPGNFNRKAVHGEKINLLKAVYGSFRAAFEDGAYFFRDTTFLVFVILAFALGYIINKKINLKMMIASVTGLLLLPVVTVFPFVLGYDVINLPGVRNENRALFVLEAAMIACMIGIATLSGSYLHAKDKLPDQKALKLVGIVTAVMVLGGGKLFWEYIPGDIVVNYSSGKIQEYSAEWMGIYEEIKNSGDEDVVVIRRMPPYVSGCAYSELRSDPEHYRSQEVARYYGKKSACLIEIIEED